MDVVLNELHANLITLLLYATSLIVTRLPMYPFAPTYGKIAHCTWQIAKPALKCFFCQDVVKQSSFSYLSKRALDVT